MANYPIHIGEKIVYVSSVAVFPTHKYPAIITDIDASNDTVVNLRYWIPGDTTHTYEENSVPLGDPNSLGTWYDPNANYPSGYPINLATCCICGLQVTEDSTHHITDANNHRPTPSTTLAPVTFASDVRGFGAHGPYAQMYYPGVSLTMTLNIGGGLSPDATIPLTFDPVNGYWITDDTAIMPSGVPGYATITNRGVGWQIDIYYSDNTDNSEDWHIRWQNTSSDPSPESTHGAYYLTTENTVGGTYATVIIVSAP